MLASKVSGSSPCFVYASICIFLLIFIAFSIVTLAFGIGGPDLYWSIFAGYEMLISFILLILHIVYGVGFILKAKKFELTYTRPKRVSLLLFLVAIFMLLRCIASIDFLIQPLHFAKWEFFILGYYLILELVPTYLVYITIKMQKVADDTQKVGDSVDMNANVWLID